MSISVIMAAYNGSNYIGESLESVLNQTLPADEVLVIDDGSKDDTGAIAESFGPPVRVIRRTNSGQSRSRNFGAQEAKGEWLAFIDHDDLWEPNKLARQMEELARRPKADLCYTARIEFWLKDGVVTMGHVAKVPDPEHIGKALFRNTTFMPSSVVMRRSTFLEAGGFDPEFNSVEDWDMWLRLYHRGIVFAGCTEPLVRYRIHPDSASHNALPSLRLLKRIYRQQVSPYLPKSTRWLSRMRSESGQEAVAALTLRRAGDPRDLQLMAISIFRDPFWSAHRYKILAHMFYTRFRKMLRI
jgi:glycosyltransferase involved in cell wall biosynthesis